MANHCEYCAEGDSALLMVFGDAISPELNRRVTSAARLIRAARIPGVLDLIPAYASLLVSYNPLVISFEALRERAESLLRENPGEEVPFRRVIEIPVCYGGEYGPDLGRIAEHAGMTAREVTDLHSSRDYLIYMLGFLPGFCYLGGLDERIHTPRLKTPRLRIPAGSVGIGGSQTGIYPLDSPGGWQLMGRTPVRTYDPHRENPILFQAGDWIRFTPVDDETYRRISGLVSKGDWQPVVHEISGEE